MVKLLTFKTNHTIIGSVIRKGDSYIVSKPVQVVMQPSENGPMVGFAPFLDFSKQFTTGIEFQCEDVLCATDPVLELENEYNRHFGSGIQVVSAK